MYSLAQETYNFVKLSLPFLSQLVAARTLAYNKLAEVIRGNIGKRLRCMVGRKKGNRNKIGMFTFVWSKW